MSQHRHNHSPSNNNIMLSLRDSHTKQHHNFSDYHHLTPPALPKISNTDDSYSMTRPTNNDMASTATVKLETDDVFHVATDSEGDTEELEDISFDELQELDNKFTTNPSKTKFPLGCKIWYNARTSGMSTKSLRAKSAYVVGVYMHLENCTKVYKLKPDTPAQCVTFRYEDRLSYGMTCPVTITDASTNDVRDGMIVCPKLCHGGDSDGTRQVSSYDVQIVQGSDIIVEFGVAADRIKYRLEKPTNSNTCSESKIKGKCEESSSTVEEEGAKEEKPTKNNNDPESALKPDTPTAQSAETTSGAATKASMKPTNNTCAQYKINGEREDRNGVNEIKANEKKEEKPTSILQTKSNDAVSAMKPGAKHLETSEISTVPSAAANSGEISALAKAGAGNIDPHTHASLAKKDLVKEPLRSPRWESPKRPAENLVTQRPHKRTKTDGDGRSPPIYTIVIRSWIPQVKQMRRRNKSISLFRECLYICILIVLTLLLC